MRTTKLVVGAICVLFCLAIGEAQEDPPPVLPPSGGIPPVLPPPWCLICNQDAPDGYHYELDAVCFAPIEAQYNTELAAAKVIRDAALAAADTRFNQDKAAADSQLAGCLAMAGGDPQGIAACEAQHELQISTATAIRDAARTAAHAKYNTAKSKAFNTAWTNGAACCVLVEDPPEPDEDDEEEVDDLLAKPMIDNAIVRTGNPPTHAADVARMQRFEQNLRSATRMIGRWVIEAKSYVVSARRRTDPSVP